ncbi:WW domain binding protein 11-domain-containing protein [Daldinia decipiens]|uniref:WW domain binding protein 11-domain-containing protein n=1 Tax=Daldinia decipiens TaxID=326647 RepID=UPI0020C21856|nr:WW domain binding protein 11-domain-containing protein [Daldinia decipiens]KAI1662403.1 WW domain binding protein 11-domain-containing protein [Daldinia decipiens]
MPKEKNFNPVQAQRKADKAKALKKGKAEAATRRNEKLAKRNPERLQKQIDDLKKITSSGGKLTKHEESILEGLERDLKAVNKAREALGDKAPSFGRSGGFRGDGQGNNNVLGKRRRGGDDGLSSDSDVPDDVKSIPMPRDTPPPIPKEILDRWYAKRRAARNANDTPLGGQDKQPPPTAPVESKTVYESKPIVRDLRKEAVSAFMPTAVRMKMEKSKGHGGLMEPEEADRLEKEGYLKATPAQNDASELATTTTGPQKVSMEEVGDDQD